VRLSCHNKRILLLLFTIITYYLSLLFNLDNIEQYHYTKLEKDRKKQPTYTNSTTTEKLNETE